MYMLLVYVTMAEKISHFGNNNFVQILPLNTHYSLTIWYRRQLTKPGRYMYMSIALPRCTPVHLHVQVCIHVHVGKAIVAQ